MKKKQHNRPATKRRPDGFRLSTKANGELLRYFAALRKAVTTMAELKTLDLNPSLNQADFECLYVETLLGPVLQRTTGNIKSTQLILEKQREPKQDATPEGASNTEPETPAEKEGESK